MISERPSPAGNGTEEIPALIETLLATEQRLEELTAGEVDTVAGRDGRTFLLRRAQEQLRNSEAAKQAAILNELRLLVDMLPVMIWFKDTENGFLRVNKRGAAATGMRVEEVEGKSAYEIFPQEAVGYYADDLEVINSGVPKMGIVEKLRDSTGQALWVQTDKVPVLDQDGKVTGLVVMAQDISDRKRDEESLRASRSNMAAAQRLAHFGSWELELTNSKDVDAGALRWSDEMFRIAGYEPDTVEVSNEFFFRLVHPEDREPIRQGIATAIRERQEYSIVHRLIRPDGEERVVQETAQILYDETTGQPARIVGTAQDITERKWAERAIERGLQRLNEAQRIGQIGDWEWDISTQAITWSPQVFEIVGRDPSLGPPRDYEESAAMYDVASRILMAESVNRAIQSGETQKYELLVLRPGGVPVYVEATAVPSKDENDRILGLHGTIQDITERRRVESALKESESRYHSLFENMVEGYAYCQTVFEQDQLRDFIYLEVNGAFEKLTGLKDVVGKNVSEVIPGIYEASPELFAVYGRVALTGRPEKYEMYLKSLGIWFSVTVYSREREHFVAVFDNITERKLAETALRESEAEFRALAEAMPQMVWITRADGWNIYFSQQWTDYTGLTLEESLGHGWNKPFHPEDQQGAWDAWQHATSTMGTYSIECRLRRADGAYRWWLIRGVPQVDSKGKLLKWFGTCTDIDDLKRAELEISRTNEALQESNEKFHQLEDNISEVFWITSPDFNTMHYVSPGYELIWGRSAASLYANPHQWIETIIAEERESAFAVFATLMGTVPEVDVEYRIARPDGTVRWIHDRGFQVRDAAGKLVRLTGIASDITERKTLEAQLRQAQKLEAMGTFAGGIAHDFNNILAAIIGYSEMAQRGISGDSRAQAHLEQVLIASTRARDLVRQILAFSSQEKPEREPLELQPIIDETLKLLRVSLRSTVEIHQHIEAATPAVLADATQIQQMIMNLCVNAGQAMKERGGVLDVRLSRIDIDHTYASAHPELNEGPHVCLEVSDTGSGMDHATQGRIFEPFFTTKAPGEGTGLGLAVVHGVVKNHGGAIDVSSELGVGTTFSIYLPVYERRRAALIQESEPVPRGNGEHILFVDDEEALVSLGKSMLEDLGYRVTGRTDSVEALMAFRLRPEEFDLVITDQTMPHMSGADLAAALLEIRPTLPVIMATGYSSAMSPERAKAIGIRELLSKPSTMQVLGEAIKRALGEDRKE